MAERHAKIAKEHPEAAAGYSKVAAGYSPAPSEYPEIVGRCQEVNARYVRVAETKPEITYTSRLIISAFTSSPFILRRATVTGSLKRRGPALPGLR